MLKTPNSLTENEVFFINKYASKNDDKIVFIGNSVANFNALKIYLKKDVLIIENKGDGNYQESLIKQVSSLKNKIIFVARGNKFGYQCEIGFLELNFKNTQFKKIFTKEYIFAGEIITTKKIKSYQAIFCKHPQKIYLMKEILL